jgi:hypothetical protein
VAAEVAGGELAAIVGAEGELARLDVAGQDRRLDTGDRLVITAA